MEVPLLVTDFLRRAARLYADKTAVVDGSRRFSYREYQERVRLFRPEELAALVDAAGLSVTERYGDYDRGPFDPRASQRVILVCEKPEGTQ